MYEHMYVGIMYLEPLISDSGARLFNHACFRLGNMLSLEYVREYIRVLCPHFSGGKLQKGVSDKSGFK